MKLNLTKLTLALAGLLFLVQTPGALANDRVELLGLPRTLTASTATTSGSVATGARKVEFLLSADFAGTIAGVTFSGANDAYKAFSDVGGIQPAIAYTISAGNLRIFVTQ